MKNIFLLCVLIITISFLLYTKTNAQLIDNPQQALNNVNHYFFIANKGQWNPEVKYLARIGGMNAWITNTGVVYDYYKLEKNIDQTKMQKINPKEQIAFEVMNTTIKGHVVKMEFIDGNKNITCLQNDKKEGYYNYFLSNDKSKWASFVPLYGNVELKGVYNNIDVKYYYDNGKLRYDYIAQPGADVSQIKLKYDGQDNISVNENGELILKTSIGEVTNGKIYAYQLDNGNKKEVQCKFEQRQDGTIRLKAASYDAKKELIIDPLVYSTFIGGDASVGTYSRGNSIAIDNAGNAYIKGSAGDVHYPTTTGSYLTQLGSCGFITKLNVNGSGLVYSTFIGTYLYYPLRVYGKDNSLAIDKNGNVYVTGNTLQDFPTTQGAFQTTYGGGSGGKDIEFGDAYVTKLNSTGSELIYSTYIGGSGDENACAIAIDTVGNAYITGTTNSVDYPITSGAFQTVYGGGSGNIFTGDAFVTKLNTTGSALIYSTYIGGSNNDYSNSIAVDAAGSAYITGHTSSQDYPITSGAFQTTYGGATVTDYNGNVYGNAFITKLNSTGSGVIYSTYIGGNEADVSNSIAVDSGGYAYITGWTKSSNYPITKGSYQTKMISSDVAIYSEVFLTKMNSTGSDLVYSTFIGGGGYGDAGCAVTIDNIGNAYITGYTKSQIYPTTPGAFQTIYKGDVINKLNDAFITELNTTGNRLIYSTYLGGSGDDLGNSIVIDDSENAYITGQTSSIDFPTTNEAYQKYYKGGYYDVFVTKINIQQISPKHDVGILKVNGTNHFTGGMQYTPSVQILNFGTSQESFNVLCKIYDYKGNFLTQSSQAVTNLVPDSIQTVNFTPYTLTDNYLYKVGFTTQLTGDLNIYNDTLAEYINTYSTSKKAVLVEIASGTWCGFSPPAQLGSNDLINNGKNVSIIAYHSSDTYATNESWDRSIGYYGISNFPTTLFDGTLKSVGACYSNMYSSYLPLYESMYSVKTPLDISIAGKVTTKNNYNITINVQKLAPFINSNTKLFVALTENKIPFSWYGQTEVDYCERTMLPSDGKGFAIDMVNHNSVSVPFNLTIQPSWSLTNLELVSWIQDIYTREVFNTTKVKLIDLSTWQANINIKDNGNVSQLLTFGQSPIGKDGIDTALGEAPLPPPAFGFDARLHLPTGDDSWKDFRSSNLDTVTWLIKFQPGEGGYPITFSWDTTKLPQGSIFLKDVITGTIVNVDMKRNNSYTLTNTGITSLRIEFVKTKQDVPVELTSFTVTANKDEVALEWQTATEKNNSGFEVQRSKDRNEYGKIGFVEGNGTTTEIHKYSFKDIKPPTAKLYYRLKQIDFNGSANYSNVIEVDPSLPTIFSLSQNYPNPFNPSTTIKYGLPFVSDVRITIYNLLGQEIETLVDGTQNAGYHETTWNASNKASGIYLYTITANSLDGKEKFRSAKKLILLK